MSEVKLIIPDKGSIIIDRDDVLRRTGCGKDNPHYEEFVREFEELLPTVRSAINPRAALGFFDYPGFSDVKRKTEGSKNTGFGRAPAKGDPVLYMICTVGAEVSEMSSAFFEEGEYVKGLLSDAMASSALFGMEKPVFKELRRICKDRHVGISKRFEAPVHVPMQIQKTAFEALNAGENLGLSITSGLMYNPVKSSCQVFAVTQNEHIMRLTHGCADCPVTGCADRMESVSIRVNTSEAVYEFCAYPGSDLLSLLQENEIYISAPCGGAGRCGKCAVYIREAKAVKEASSQALKEALPSGMRKELACRYIVNESCEVSLIGSAKEDITALGSIEPRSQKAVLGGGMHPGSLNTSYSAGSFAIAIDIGTTTLALSLTDPENGRVIDTHTAVNRQRRFGADVITRIEAACAGKASLLRESICRDLADGISVLLTQHRVDPERLTCAAAAGNTTMLHLLMGYPAKGLGIYPFTAHTLKLEKHSLGDVLGSAADALPLSKLKDIPFYLLPGFSVFVGADIVSGLYSLDLFNSTELCAFIDLGTNGEMAVGNRDRLLVTSTAAGPAFEGGNIEYGIGSIPGAISSVSLAKKPSLPVAGAPSDDRLRVGGSNKIAVDIQTIGNKPPAGICGTGVIEAVAELLRVGLIDETGMLDEEYFEDGFPLALMHSDVPEKEVPIILTQKDIREIQLAKSAIRAGFEILLKRFGTDYNGISRLFIAGGFGYYLDVKKAAAIGMIPRQLIGKAEAVGNSSLNGVIRFLTALYKESSSGQTTIRRLKELAESGEEIPLSSDPDFGSLYMQYMMFE